MKVDEISNYVWEFLKKNPTPSEILQLAPTPEMQARATQLLQKNKEGNLATDESNELDQYVRLNHLVTLLKTDALRNTQQRIGYDAKI